MTGLKRLGRNECGEEGEEGPRMESKQLQWQWVGVPACW
jgi:hypothetical protein